MKTILKREKMQKNNFLEFKNVEINGEENSLYIDDTISTQSNIVIKVKGNNNKIYLSKNIQIKGTLLISITGNNNSILIDENTFINRKLHCVIFTGGPGGLGHNCTIKIGKNVFFNGDVNLMCGEEKTSIVIGARCLFASNINLTTSDNHSIFDMQTKQRVNKAGDIKIGEHCWICNDVTILNHSFIGDECVIATKALVTSFASSQPPSNCIIGGIPAKIIKRGIMWDRYLKDNL